MKIRRWLGFDFVKEGFMNYLWNFHYIVLFGIITLIFCIGVITVGPALMALASSTRLIAINAKITVGYYFKEFKRLLLPGILLSLIIIICLASLWSSFSILSMNISRLYNIFAFLAIAVISVIFFFLIYYPFAGFTETRSTKIIIKSVLYTTIHFWDTVVQISILYLVWKLLSFSPPLLMILFLPTSTYIINRFILGNNEEVNYK